MRIEQLMYLVEISKHRSMNKASERLFLSPQALSLSMKSLEENLGIQLLVRTPQGITFTEAGKRLVEISEIFLNELSEIQKDSKIINLFGDVELYTPEPLLENFFAKPLGKFYKDYPNLDIHIKSFEYEKMIEFLCKKQLPYCFWYQCYIDKVNIIQDIPDMYSFIPMMEVKFFCCASKEHRFLKKCKNISLYELRDETVIIHTPSKYILDKILDYAQISPKVIGAQNVILMNEMVRANVGIAFSSFSINKFKNCIPYDNSLIQVPFRENIVGEIGYLLPKGKILEPKLKIFLNLIEKELTDI